MSRALAELSALDAIAQRRSVRSYTPTPVRRPTIERLLDAAVHAPTAIHEEPWVFAIVQDRALLKRLSDEAKRTMTDRPERFILPDNIFYDAGTLIVIYGKPLSRFAAADCWLAAENLMLAARALGLGTCVIGLAVEALNSPDWKSRLNVPGDCTAYAPIIVGEPAGEPPPTSRLKPEIAAWL